MQLSGVRIPIMPSLPASGVVSDVVVGNVLFQVRSLHHRDCLQWANIDLDNGTINGTITTQRNMVEVKDHMHEQNSKSAAEFWTVMIPKQTVKILRTHKKRQEMERASAKYWEDSDLVFCTKSSLLKV